MSEGPGSHRAFRPLRHFLETEGAGAIVLVVATAAALLWANLPFSESYDEVWETRLSLGLGRWEIHHDLRHWINEGLMTLFFLVVALEIKREVVRGELNDTRRAALPVFAAVGGMVVPALVYLAFNRTGIDARGWGVPMATDIAFALGVIALVAPGLPQWGKVFLLSLAIVDDIGAIIVIALFYSSGIDWVVLGIAAGAAGAMFLLRMLGIRSSVAFIALGIFVWLTTMESGIHATIAGVVIGLVTPVRPASEDTENLLRTSLQRLRDQPSPQKMRIAKEGARDTIGPGEWLEHLLHPWTSLVIIPLFALANAGIVIDGEAISDAAGSSVALGVFLGLVLGKPLGVALAVGAATRLGLASLPSEASWRDIVGLGAVAGIGFTVSLFITELAFPGGVLASSAKVAILGASFCAAVAGAILLRGGPSRREKIEP